MLPPAPRHLHDLGGVRRFGVGLFLFITLFNAHSAGGVAQLPSVDSTPQHQSVKDAWTLAEERRYGEAEALARGLLAKLEADGRGGSLEAADILDVFAHALSLGGKGREPESPRVAERAIEIRERLQGPDHVSLARSLEILGAMWNNAGSYDRAKAVFERSVGILERAHGPSHPDVARCLIGMGNALLGAGNHEQAIATFARAHDILVNALGPEDLGVARAAFSLGSAYSAVGDYVRARPLQESGLLILEKLLGPNHPDVAKCLNNLGNLCGAMGDRVSGIQLHARALMIREKAYGPDHSWVAVSVNNLGNQYAALADLDRAIPLYERALAIWDAADPEHPYSAMAAHNLGAAFVNKGAFAQARPLLQRALIIRERELGADHPEVAEVLVTLGRLEAAEGNLDRAGASYRRALAIRESTLGARHPLVAECLVELGNLAASRGANQEALVSALLGEEIGREHLRLTARAFAERQGLEYSSVRVSGLGAVVSAAVRSGTPSSARAAWDAITRSRTLVLDEMGSRRQAEIADPDAAPLRTELEDVTRRLANLLVRGPSGESGALYRSSINDVREQQEETERRLAAHSATFRQALREREIGFAQVTAALPPEWALVAYVRYEHHGPPSSDSPKRPPARGARAAVPSYAAFLVSSAESPPIAIPLGRSAEIDSLIQLWRYEASQGMLDLRRSEPAAERAYRDAGSTLRARIWDPVAGALAGATRVFVVADGELHLVSLAALPSESGGYLVEQEPIVHYLSAERDLVRAPDPARGEGLLALGGVDFDASLRSTWTTPSAPSGQPLMAGLSSLSDPSIRSGGAGPRPVENGPFRGHAPDCAEFGSRRFRALPASAQEVKEIAALWTSGGIAAPRFNGRDALPPQSALSPATVLEAAHANESAFKLHSPGKRVIHLATHAFFLDARCDSVPSEASHGRDPVGVSGERAAPAAQADLRLSGLVLAGANQRSAAGPEDEDGILTAEEIAATDLSGVELAVLSGCQTGVGAIQAGEGVLGLRRAFQIAGAGSVIMSLWAVEDGATREWMHVLYQSRLIEQMAIADAVRVASLRVLAARCSRGESTHPFYWGAFVAAGEWR